MIFFFFDYIKLHTYVDKSDDKSLRELAFRF